MVRESTTTTPSSGASSCAMSPTRPRRRPSPAPLAPLLLPLLLLLLAGAGPRDAHAAARIFEDDALLGSDLTTVVKEVRDNRVRPDGAAAAGASRTESELLLVHVLFRHGDRTPDPPSYPNDPYANFTYEPVGLGALTPAGKRTEYRIGQFLRQRYGDFLGGYRAGLAAARTTDWPRTKDSMALVLAGLFPPAQQDEWSGSDSRGEEATLGRLWMPIASESTPRDQDKLLYMWDVPCPAYDRQYAAVLESPAFQKQFRTANAALIAYLEKHSGGKINTPEDVYNIYQALLAQQGFNLTLPSWTSEVFPDKMKPLTALYFELDAYNRQMQRLRAGPLLKRMLRHSVAKSRGLLRPAERKLYLYAAHDNNVSALLQALRVWDHTLPPYGTAVIVEVRRTAAGQVGVEMYLRNSTTTDDVSPLVMPECEHFCPLNRFVQLTSDVIPNDWDAECQGE
ncbi:Venom acid phosphatase Acph-1 [Frankliniella fusca]|uniref:acid phosphatase n=1 Tax=Frankliniella fusca TaxID=407009 RepID=A0AAE1L7B5_9NEOP|nr:Venom acid phosphatase Acph-1 [Frankliniella fusca]